ncbi:hypothetical protein [Oceanibacterium hippocampi]|nr:hypothetical protein [Oceanibacterium hippocampi]
MLFWGLPIAAMLAAIVAVHPLKTIVWATALVWMGAACLVNARRCGRTHCYFTGPFFLLMTIPVLLHGYHVFWLGTDGWKWLGIAVGVGGGGLWCLTEKLWGRFLGNA